MPINNSFPKFSFYSLIPELKEESGHHVQYHRHISETVYALGGKFSAFMNKRCRIRGLSADWKTWFRRRRKKKYILLDPCWLFLDFSKLFLKKENEDKRIFFLESFALVDFVPFVLSALFFAKKNDVIWILFRYQRNKQEMSWYKGWIRWAKKKLGERCVLLSDSDLLGSFLRKQFRQPVFYLPHYIFTPPKNDISSDKIECSWLGAPREEKGLKYIERLMRTEDPASFQFRLSVSEQMSIHPNPLLNLRKFRASLPRDVYDEEFARAHVLLLPYEKPYRLRTSGIFIEGVLGGKIPLVKAGTWLAHQLREHGLQELIVDWENPLFFTHLSHLINNQEVKKRLSSMRENYRTLHSVSSLIIYFEKLILN